MADPVDIFGSATDAPVEEIENPTGDDDKNKGAGDGAGDEGDDDEEGDDKNKGGEDDDGDDEEDDIDLDKETDPEKLRAAAKKHADASKKKSESIKNLRRARRKTAAAATAPEVGEFTPPYSQQETTLVKDLPKDVRDSMTENEKRLHDDNVKIKTQLNNDAKEKHDAKVDAAKKAAEQIDDSVVLDDEVEEFVKDIALDMANGDKRQANEIIKYFNKYNKDVSGLTEDEIIDRVGDAHKLTGSYRPPRDQQRKNGKAPKKNGADPHGVDSIVNSLDSGGTKKAFEL